MSRKSKRKRKATRIAKGIHPCPYCARKMDHWHAPPEPPELRARVGEGERT